MPQKWHRVIAFDHVETSNTPVDLADNNSMFLEHRYPNSNSLFVYIIYDFSAGITLHVSAQLCFAFTFLREGGTTQPVNFSSHRQ